MRLEGGVWEAVRQKKGLGQGCLNRRSTPRASAGVSSGGEKRRTFQAPSGNREFPSLLIVENRV